MRKTDFRDLVYACRLVALATAQHLQRYFSVFPPVGSAMNRVDGAKNAFCVPFSTKNYGTQSLCAF